MDEAAIRRDLHIDLVKAVAIIAVAVIHSCVFTDPVGSSGWKQSVLLGCLVRPAVPLFLMCSGAMLLRPEKDLPLRRLLLHNLLRLVAAMLFWAFVYKLAALLPGGLTWEGVRQSAAEVLTFNHHFHFYYLHIMLVVYLLLPVLRVFVRAAEKRQVEYALVLWFLLGIVYPVLLYYPAFQPLTYGIPLQWAINMVYASAGYGLLGWYLRRWPLPVWAEAGMFLLGYGIVVAGTELLSRQQGWLNELWMGGMTPGVCLMAAGSYGLLRRLAGHLRGGRIVTFLSKGSFCVYLVHAQFLLTLGGAGLTAAAFTPRALATLATAAAALACSYASYVILSKIPGVNRWLI